MSAAPSGGRPARPRPALVPRRAVGCSPSRADSSGTHTVITAKTLVARHFTATPGRLVRMRRARMLVGGAVCAVALAGCAAGSGGTGAELDAEAVVLRRGVRATGRPAAGPTGAADRRGVPSPGSSSGTRKQGDPAVVAKHLTTPVGITIMPDNTALVGERTTGRIVRVQPQPDQPVRTVRVLHGLSTAGGGGLLDLAVSPNYREDNLIFAYVTTPEGQPRRRLHPRRAGHAGADRDPPGRTGNAGRLTFAADGSLLVGTGDAGRPSLARTRRSLAGQGAAALRHRPSGAGQPDQGLAGLRDRPRRHDRAVHGDRLDAHLPGRSRCRTRPQTRSTRSSPDATTPRPPPFRPRTCPTPPARPVAAPCCATRCS